MENRHRWMERSLRQTGELGLEVLERARRREVDWSAGCRSGGMTHGEQSREEITEEEGQVSPEEVFATMADFMRHTTEQCAIYHNSLPVRRISQQEMKHNCRFHCRKFTQRDLNERALQSPTPGPPQSIRVQRIPQDVHIEVAPGTYSISACSRGSPRQTHVVNITPGQSVDLTFTV
ncbi:A-kinase-interacting protein 1 [Rhinophrynus dorsalis]